MVAAGCAMVAPRRADRETPMPGRPPTPFRLQLLRGNPGKRALRPEPEPGRSAECPDPPGFLPPYAAEEWRRVASPLWHCHLLTIADVQPLAAYCCAYSRWRLAEEALTRMGGELVIKTRTGVRQNPLVRVARAAAVLMLNCAAQIGATPAARSRIAHGVNPDPPPPDWAA
jgi:P27 family predicted phage terminase small subunit